MKRALLLLVSAAALCFGSLPEATAASGGPGSEAGARSVAVEADYDPSAAYGAGVQPDLDTLLDYIDSDGGLMAGLRYIVLLLFSH